MKVSHFHSWFSRGALVLATLVALDFFRITSAGAAEKDRKAKPEEAAIAATLADVIDLAGRPVNPFTGKAKVTVLVFVDPECPISNRYAPEIQRLARAFQPKDAAFWLVYPDADLSIETIQKHMKAYGYS